MDSGAGGIVFKVAVFALIGLALYYFYKWLNGSGELTDQIIYTDVYSGLPGKAPKPSVFTSVNTNMPELYEGGEFSVSTWIYITNWEVNKGYNKPFLTLSGGGGAGGFKTLVMYLGQNVPKLGVRVSTTATSFTTTELAKIRPLDGTNHGVSPYTDAGGDFKKCDVEEVDLQRWVCINAVLNGRTLDLYIDGKMTRSCVLDSMFKVDGDAPEILLGGPYGFGGIIGQTQAANFAYSPDQVYKIYQNGPLDTSIWSKIKGYFDPSQYSFSVQRNGQNVVSGSM